jgi:hypothetical protein
MTKHHAFAQSQPVRFDGAFPAQFGREFFGWAGGGENLRARGGDSMLLHEVLGKGFRGLKLGGPAVWPPNAQAVLLKEVHNAQGQRIVRPNDREINSMFLGQRKQGRQVFRRDIGALDWRSVARQALGSDAGVARRAPQACGTRRLSQLPHQRVFASARPNDQDFHDGGLKQEEQALARLSFSKSSVI